MDEFSGPDLSHPDALIRLASAVHQFKCPEMGSKKLSFSSSFRTSASSHDNTIDLMKNADAARGSLLEALHGSRSDSTSSSRAIGSISHESVVNAAGDYIPLAHQVLVSCKFQPDTARLDQRLLFEWTSGIESGKKRTKFKSEALMYELVMTVACEGLGTIGMACDASVSGDFPTASRRFKAAAGIFEFLAQDQLPKWIARGSSVESKDLPSEVTVGTCEALKLLCLACAQQMAVATVLVKPGAPNYTLLAKLSLGISEQLDHAVTTFRTKASHQMDMLDPNIFNLLAFQTTLQRGLSLYFLSRSLWDESDYGVAIALLKEAMSLIRTRDGPTSAGLPDTGRKSGLAALDGDLKTFQAHLTSLLRSWEKDNSSIYFDKVPRPVPEEKKLAQGMSMMKAETYKLDDVEPLPLSIPTKGNNPPPPPYPDLLAPPSAPPPPIQRTDSDLARELQAKLNAGEDI